MRPRTHRPAVLSALALFLWAIGCIGQNPPITVRFFRPILPEARQAPLDEGRPLDLASVNALTQREQMAWRFGVEYVFDDANRWVAPPAALIRSAIESRLFVEAGFQPGRGPGVPSLEVQVLAFERTREQAVLELAATVTPGTGAAPRFATIRKVVDLPSSEAEAFALAMGVALGDACEQLVRLVGGTPPR